MRKTKLAGLTGVLVLALAAVAFAVQTNSATISFTKKKHGATTGVTSVFKIADAGNTTAGQEGKPTNHIRRVDIMFPKGMTFNWKALKQCKTSSTSALKAGVCNKYKIGSGTTKVDARPAFGKLNATLTAFNAKGGLLILIRIKENTQLDQVLNPKFVVKKGATTLVTKLPAALEAVGAELTDFKLTIPAKTGKIGKKKTGFVVLPKTCPKGKKWTVKTRYYLKSGATDLTKGTVNKCS